MRGRLVRWREGIVIGLLLTAGGAAWAQESFNVTGLRMSKVTLYKDCNMDKGVPFTREDLEKRKPLRATRDPNTSVHYWVKLDDGNYCVKAFAVETDKAVPVTKDEECNTRVAGRPPKTGAVRGVGEGCGK